MVQHDLVFRRLLHVDQRTGTGRQLIANLTDVQMLVVANLTLRIVELQVVRKVPAERDVTFADRNYPGVQQIAAVGVRGWVADWVRVAVACFKKEKGG